MGSAFTKISTTGQRILGTWIEDAPPCGPVALWMQQQLRGGDSWLAHKIAAYAAQQLEQPDPLRVRVVQASLTGIECCLPCAVVDHESPHPFRCDLYFALDPWTGAITPLTR